MRTAKDWYEYFETHRGGRVTADNIVAIQDDARGLNDDKEYTGNGIEYTWGLDSPEGARFVLMPIRGHTSEQVEKAKRLLRDSQDVLSVKVEWQNQQNEH